MRGEGEERVRGHLWTFNRGGEKRVKMDEKVEEREGGGGGKCIPVVHCIDSHLGPD